MILSDDRISVLTHLVLDSLIEKRMASLLETEEKVLREIRKVIGSELKILEDIDQKVRIKLSSFSRPPVEGSPEWDVQYKKFLNEELQKRKI
ncbi:MAG TPA: DUF507 family protein [Nitrospiria bacterium]|nr:DUF507 family protein [Nitrospiria bacterium]